MPQLPNYARIKPEVNRLLMQNRIDHPPVNVEEIAKSMGAEIRYEPFEDDISGVLYRDQHSTIIGVNSLHHPNRQRFTIAHEIGHHVLHRFEMHVDKGYRMIPRDSVSSRGVDRREIEANQFAAELLMPEQMVVKDIRKHLLDIENEGELQELARLYRVSNQAMAFRIAKLRVYA